MRAMRYIWARPELSEENFMSLRKKVVDIVREIYGEAMCMAFLIMQR